MNRSDYIGEHVRGVSRSFAFVIDQLDEPLRREVQIAYLLFRIGDSIEDTARIVFERKYVLLETLVGCFERNAPFGGHLPPVATLDDLTLAERALLMDVDRVIVEFGRLTAEARTALIREARVMFTGMLKFQRRRADGPRVIADEREFAEYCYYVAGTVGDYLTERFIAAMPELSDAARTTLNANRRGLALVLQATNILRDFMSDLERGQVFYPRSFLPASFDGRRADHERRAILTAGTRIVGWLAPALAEARDYVLAIPPVRRRIRVFTIVPFVMALKTLRRAVGNPGIFDDGSVKISRFETRKTVVLAKMFADTNRVLAAWLDGCIADVREKAEKMSGPAARG